MGIALSISASCAVAPGNAEGVILPMVATLPVVSGPWTAGTALTLDGTPTATLGGTPSPVTAVHYQLTLDGTPTEPWGPSPALTLPADSGGATARLLLRVQVQDAPGLWSPAGVIDTQTVVAAPVTTTTITVANHGAAFTATDVTAHGTYGDGSPWILADASAALTAMAPLPTPETGTLDTTSYTNATLHGAMVNPGQSTVPLATLAVRQQDNHRTASGQAFDERTRAGEVPYDASRNADPAISGQPIPLDTPKSIVKAVSNTNAQAGTIRRVVGDLGVLTVVSAPPPHADSCRPAVALPDKASRWRAADLVVPAPVANASAATLPAYSEITEAISYLQLNFDTNNSACRAITPGPDNGYGGSTAKYFGNALLWLYVGGGTVAERTEVARLIAQAAEDVRGRVLQGGIFPRSGGFCYTTEVILRAGELLLPGRFTDALTTLVEATDGLLNIGFVGFGQRALPEMDRVKLITQDILDIPSADITAPYAANQLGWPEWCDSFGTGKTLPGESANYHEALENYLEDPTAPYSGNDKPSYRFITMAGMVPLTLALRLSGSDQLNGHAIYWDYVDRHMTKVASDIPTFQTNNNNRLDDWVLEAWQDLRGPGGLWAPPGDWAVTTGTGQATIASFPPPPAAPTVIAGNGQATLETA